MSDRRFVYTEPRRVSVERHREKREKSDLGDIVNNLTALNLTVILCATRCKSEKREEGALCSNCGNLPRVI